MGGVDQQLLDRILDFVSDRVNHTLREPIPELGWKLVDKHVEGGNDTVGVW
jgi:hypothetical protein